MIGHALKAQADAVRRKLVTARTLVEDALARADAEADLNAFITLLADAALADADRVDAQVAAGADVGVLAGAPLVVKDNIDVAGAPTTAGTPAIHYVPKRSAPVVARLNAAGAVVIGKTNMHELAFGFTSNNAAFGAVKNPVDRTRFPGGSSGGTAAAIAAGIVAGGLGTDTAGSVRIPAALTGTAGFRPTTTSVPTEGIVPSVPAFDVPGPMGASIDDCALLYAVMAGSAPAELRSVRGLRLGVAEPQASGLSETTATAFGKAVETLQAAGVEIAQLDLGDILSASFDAGFPVGFYQMRSAMTAYLAAHMPGVSLATLVERIASPDVKSVYTENVLGPGAPSQAACRDALGRLPVVQANYLAVLDAAGVDGVIYPTARLEAQRIEGGAETVVLGGTDIPILQAYLRNIVIASVVGAPGISLPLPVSEGALPVGLALDGRPGGDADVLGMGLGLAAALGA